MTIAPNGVDIADFDPLGVGSIMFLSAQWNGTAYNLYMGDTVDAAVLGLRPAGLIDYPTDAAEAIQYDATVTVTGTWKCLGRLNLAASTVNEAAALFIRVS